METLDKLSSPAKVVRKLLEADVQKQCVDWMRARGYWARKFSSMTQRSVPDYLFARAGDHTYQDIKFATEFKAPGKTGTDAQVDEQTAMRDAGWHVFECDDFEDFKAAVLAYEEKNRKWG
jgi:hypothetical protein